MSDGFKRNRGEIRSLGVHAGLTLSRYRREEDFEYLSGFESSYFWDESSTRRPALARQVSEAGECLILRGELEDRNNLDYLRDSVGLLTWLLDHGGVCIHDPQTFHKIRDAAWPTQFDRRSVVRLDPPIRLPPRIGLCESGEAIL